MKECSKCQQNLPLSEFSWHNKSKNKLYNKCKKCQSICQSIYRKTKNATKHICSGGCFESSKKCTKCYIVKFTHEFPVNYTRSDFHASSCKKCHYKTNKIRTDKYKKRNHNCKLSNCDYILILCPQCKISHPQSFYVLDPTNISHHNKTCRITAYKNGAKRRNLDFSITNEIALKLMNEICFYCNSKGFGIDRIISEIGYIEGNVVPCCTVCNYLKSNDTVQEFLGKIEVYRNIPQIYFNNLLALFK